MRREGMDPALIAFPAPNVVCAPRQRALVDLRAAGLDSGSGCDGRGRLPPGAVSEAGAVSAAAAFSRGDALPLPRAAAFSGADVFSRAAALSRAGALFGAGASSFGGAFSRTAAFSGAGSGRRTPLPPAIIPRSAFRWSDGSWDVLAAAGADAGDSRGAWIWGPGWAGYN